MKFFPSEDFEHAGAPSLIHGEMINRKEFLWETFEICVKYLFKKKKFDDLASLKTSI